MLDRVTAYAECFEEPEHWAIATIVSIQGSSPSPVGTSMAVSADHRIIGSLSGGCVESSVAETAREAITDGLPRRRMFGPEEALSKEEVLGEVTLTCGGRIEVLIQPLHTLNELTAARELSRTDPRSPAQLCRTVCDDAGVALEVEEHRSAAPLLFIAGIHDVSVQLARCALNAGWQVHLAEARSDFAAPDRVPSGAEVTTRIPETALRAVLRRPQEAEAWTAVCVMTHHRALDVPVLDAALRHRASDGSGIDLIGAMGSRRASARRTAALEARGHSAQEVARVRTPLGLDIQASTPAETATSMFAELICVKNAGGAEAAPNGTPLSVRSGPLHRGPRHRSLTRELVA